jgi:hypothetical protein
VAAGLEASAARDSGAAAAAAANSLRVTVTPPGGVGERVAQGSIIDDVPRVTQMDFWANFPGFTPSGHKPACAKSLRVAAALPPPQRSLAALTPFASLPHHCFLSLAPRSALQQH